MRLKEGIGWRDGFSVWTLEHLRHPVGLSGAQEKGQDGEEI
jgi:hypothetical protein